MQFKYQFVSKLRLICSKSSNYCRKKLSTDLQVFQNLIYKVKRTNTHLTDMKLIYNRLTLFTKIRLPVQYTRALLVFIYSFITIAEEVYMLI